MNGYDQHQTTIEKEPVAELLKDLRDESLNLVRQQVELAKQETLEKVSRLGRNAAYLVIGGLVAYTGLLFLLWGLNFLGTAGFIAAGFTQTTSLWIMSLITGIVIGIVGYIFVQKAINTFKNTSIVPDKTVHSLKEDKKWIAGKRQ